MSTPKATFKKLVRQAIGDLYEDMFSCVRIGEPYAYACLDMPDGCWIDISTDNTDDTKAVCHHMRENGEHSTNVERYILERIPTWTQVVEDVLHERYINSFK